MAAGIHACVRVSERSHSLGLGRDQISKISGAGMGRVCLGCLGLGWVGSPLPRGQRMAAFLWRMEARGARRACENNKPNYVAHKPQKKTMPAVNRRSFRALSHPATPPPRHTPHPIPSTLLSPNLTPPPAQPSPLTTTPSHDLSSYRPFTGGLPSIQKAVADIEHKAPLPRTFKHHIGRGRSGESGT